MIPLAVFIINVSGEYIKLGSRPVYQHTILQWNNTQAYGMTNIEHLS